MNYMLLAFQAAASSFRSIFPAADLGIACVCEEICVGDLSDDWEFLYVLV